jgi:hypothetical protein
VRELNTFGPARLEPDLKEGLVVAGHLDGDPGALSVTSAEELRRRGNRASHIPSTAQGADLIAGQIIRDNSRDCPGTSKYSAAVAAMKNPVAF